MKKTTTLQVTQSELINLISETVIAVTEQKYGKNSKGETTYDGYTYAEHARQWDVIEKYFGCDYTSFQCGMSAIGP